MTYFWYVVEVYDIDQWAESINQLFLIMYHLGFIITLRESALTVKKFEQPCRWETIRLLRDTAAQVSNFRCEMYDKNMQCLNKFICQWPKVSFCFKVSTSPRGMLDHCRVIPNKNLPYPFILLGGEIREHKTSCSRTQHTCPGQGLNPTPAC